MENLMNLEGLNEMTATIVVLGPLVVVVLIILLSWVSWFWGRR